jgi:hypothetical protein
MANGAELVGRIFGAKNYVRRNIAQVYSNMADLAFSY